MSCVCSPDSLQATCSLPEHAGTELLMAAMLLLAGMLAKVSAELSCVLAVSLVLESNHSGSRRSGEKSQPAQALSWLLDIIDRQPVPPLIKAQGLQQSNAEHKRRS